MLFFRTPFNYDTTEASDESALRCDDESLAIQSAKEDADINTIVRRFGLTGELPNDVTMPTHGDFTAVPDFQTAMNLVTSAQSEFMRIPADLRARFNNDPHQLISFLDNDANRDAARELGLLKPVDAPVPPVRVVMETPPPVDK